MQTFQEAAVVFITAEIAAHIDFMTVAIIVVVHHISRNLIVHDINRETYSAPFLEAVIHSQLDAVGIVPRQACANYGRYLETVIQGIL